MTDLELVLEATERILKGYPEDLMEVERWERFSADAALCAAYIQELQAAQRDLVERVAEALYERAMGERRVFSPKPGQFDRRWRDEPYVPPLAEGESRPVDWRDGWRDGWRDEALPVVENN